MADEHHDGLTFSADELDVLQQAAAIRGETLTGFVHRAAVETARSRILQWANATGSAVRCLYAHEHYRCDGCKAGAECERITEHREWMERVGLRDRGPLEMPSTDHAGDRPLP